MHEKEAKPSPVVLITVSLAVLALWAYITGYFLLGRREFMPGTKKQQRIVVFEREWEARVYQPMTAFETRLTRIKTHVGTEATFGVLSD